MLMSRWRPREEQGGEPVHDDSGCSDDRHHPALGYRGVEQPPHRLGPDRSDCNQQQQGIGERREDRRFLQPIGEAR